MTPRKETEPTKEHIEEAKVLSLYSGLKDRSEARKKIALWLARRDEARDAEVVRPLIPYMKHLNGCSTRYYGPQENECSCGFDVLKKSLLSLALASPSPASSEPRAQDPDECPGISDCEGPKP